MLENKNRKGLSGMVDRVFILDESTKFLGEKYPIVKNVKIITSQDDLGSIIPLKNKLKNVIVFCELKWGNKLYQDFYGFEIARELRMRYKLLCPIILISVLSQNYFEKKAQKDIKYNVLYGRGTGFIEWYNINNLDSISNLILPLSEAVLADLNGMLLNLKGFVIDKITHDLQTTLNINELKTRINFIDNYLDNEQKAKIGWDDFVNKILKNENVSNFEKLKEEFLVKCRQELGNETETIMKGDFIKKYKILVVEDDPGFMSTIEENLKNYFELITTNNSEEAIKMVDDDGTNSIVGIISDWRLYADNSKTYWQHLQGYEILEYASNKRFVALFSLTSEDDRNVHEIRNKLGLDINLFKKQHLINDNNWDIFADIIRQKYNDINDLISSMPSSPTWTKQEKSKPSYFEQYREKRNNINWKRFERSISEEADKLWENFKNHFEKHENVSPLSEYGIHINNLESVLIVRRIWFALWFKRNEINRNDPIKAIYDIIRGTFDQPDMKKSNKHSVFANSLAIKSEELPKELLPEEKNWLIKNDISIEPYSIENPEEDYADNEKEPSDDEIREIEDENFLNDDFEI